MRQLESFFSAINQSWRLMGIKIYIFFAFKMWNKVKHKGFLINCKTTNHSSTCIVLIRNGYQLPLLVHPTQLKHGHAQEHMHLYSVRRIKSPIYNSCKYYYPLESILMMAFLTFLPFLANKISGRYQTHSQWLTLSFHFWSTQKFLMFWYLRVYIRLLTWES